MPRMSMLLICIY